MHFKFKKIILLGLVATSAMQAMDQAQTSNGNSKPDKLITKEAFARVWESVNGFPHPLIRSNGDQIADLVYDYAAAPPCITFLHRNDIRTMGLVQRQGKPMVALVKLNERREGHDLVSLPDSTEFIDPHSLKSDGHSHLHTQENAVISEIVGCGNNLAATKTGRELVVFTTDTHDTRLRVKNDRLYNVCADDGIIVAPQSKLDHPKLLNPNQHEHLCVFQVPGRIVGLCAQDKNKYVAASDKGVWEIDIATAACTKLNIQLDEQFSWMSNHVLPLKLNGQMRIVGRSEQTIAPLDDKPMPEMSSTGKEILEVFCGDLVPCGSNHIATGSDLGTVRVFDLNSGKVADSFALSTTPYSSWENRIEQLAATKDGSLLVARTAQRLAIIRRGGMWHESDEQQQKTDAAKN